MRNQGLEACQQLQQLVVNRALAEQWAVLLPGLVPLVRAWAAACRRAAERWTNREAEQVRRAMGEMRNQRLADGHSLGLNALSIEGFTLLTSWLETTIDDQRLVDVVADWLATSATGQEDVTPSLARLLFDAARELVGHSKECREWDLFEAIYQAELLPANPNAKVEEAIDRALKRLGEYGVPFWTLDESLWSGFDKVAHINLLGYERIQDHDGQSAAWVLRARQILRPHESGALQRARQARATSNQARHPRLRRHGLDVRPA